jgi:signal transduction histidine kinase
MLVKVPRGSGPTIELAVTEQSPVQLDESAADHVYRIAQEAIKNSISHGRATTIRVVVEVSPKTIILEVFDNGKGCKTESIRGHGMDIMRYRSREIRGELAIVRSNNGMRVRCTCPNVGTI